MDRPALDYPTYDVMLRAVATRLGSKAAVICGERRRTYSDLDAQCSKLAAALLKNGVGRGDRIGILARNSDIYIELLFGIARAGAVAVVLNWRLSATELGTIVADAGLWMLFHDNEFSATSAKINVSQLNGKITIGTPTAISDEYLSYLAATAGENFAPVNVSPDDIFCIMYTSGTTGKPKGIPSSHYAALFGCAIQLAASPEAAARQSDINLLTTPLFHIAGLGWISVALMVGGTVVVLPQPDMPAMLEAIEKHRVTRAVFLPTVMPALLAAATEGRNLSSLHTITYGASAIPEPLLKNMINMFDCGFLQSYGMSEISGPATHLDPQDHYIGSTVLASCGRPYPGVDIQVIDGNRALCQAREIGEIMIRTPALMAGYWKNPALTKEVIQDGWYASGDMGFLDEAGYLFLKDRKNDMIISGGENIYPAEIESALTGHPDVERVAVFGVPSEKWGEEVKALVISRPGSLLTPEELEKYLRSLLGGYKIPKTIELVDTLPVSAVGKVLKHELRERYWVGHERHIN